MSKNTFQIVFTPWAHKRLTQYLDYQRFIPFRHYSVFKALNRMMPVLRKNPFDFPIDYEISEDPFAFQYFTIGRIKAIFWVDTDLNRVVIVELCFDV